MAGGKRAVTHYATLQPLKEASLIECRLETGRTHQVRVHMASIGHSLLGDPAYGRTKPVHRALLETLGFKRQALHAARLGFIHPVKSNALSFDSEMPADMQRSVDPLRDDPVAHIDQSCVGCGNCGEVADAAVLCPSFYRADVVHNPSRWDRFLESARRAVIGLLQRRRESRRLTFADA